jgi:hypothetical protein
MRLEKRTLETRPYSASIRPAVGVKARLYGTSFIGNRPATRSLTKVCPAPASWTGRINYQRLSGPIWCGAVLIQYVFRVSVVGNVVGGAGGQGANPSFSRKKKDCNRINSASPRRKPGNRPHLCFICAIDVT